LQAFDLGRKERSEKERKEGREGGRKEGERQTNGRMVDE
jgi:hypothetical protein